MNLNAPVKCVVALLIIAICVGVFYFADWQGKMEDIERVVKENESLTAELADKRKQIEELPRLTKEKQELEAELARVVQTNLVPEKAEMFVANYLKEIEKLITEESYRTGDKSLEILSITPGALTQKNSEGSEGESSDDGEGGSDILKSFPTRTFQMTMNGKYNTLIEFLYQLGDLRLERLVTIDKIALAPGSSDKPGESPVLSIQIPITAYLRQ
ncbi:hypothetical protein IJT10_08430 [bacterium]|nr:hypothetical protein [bacterium]